MQPHSAPAAMPAKIIRGTTTNGGVPAGRTRHEHDGRRAPGAHQQLALRADVPEPHPEGERAGEAGEDERRGLDQRVREHADGCRTTASQDVREGADRVAADERDEDAAEMSSATATAPSVVASGSQRGTSSRRSRRSSRGSASDCVVEPERRHGRRRWPVDAAAASAAHRRPPVMSSPMLVRRPRPRRRTCP